MDVAFRSFFLLGSEPPSVTMSSVIQCGATRRMIRGELRESTDEKRPSPLRL